MNWVGSNWLEQENSRYMLVKSKEQRKTMPLEMLTVSLSTERTVLSARSPGLSYLGHWIRITGSHNSRRCPPHHSLCQWCYLKQHCPLVLSVKMELFYVCPIKQSSIVVVTSHMCPWTLVLLRK